MFTGLPYAVILILQGICVLHVLKSGRDFKWIFLIVFIPLFGCGIYFFTQMLPGLRSAALPEFDIPIFQKMRIAQVEKGLRNCDSMDNRVELAELYAKFGRENEALALIQDHVSGVHRDSPYLLFTYALILFQNKKYQESYDVLVRLQGISETVRKRERKLLLGRNCAAMGRLDEAEGLLRDACKGFNGEEARYWFAQHLCAVGKFQDAIVVAREGIEYFRDSESLYRKQERSWYKGLKSLLSRAERGLQAGALKT
jgi:hypothetical protein